MTGLNRCRLRSALFERVRARVRVYVLGGCRAGCAASQEGRTERRLQDLRKETLSAPPLGRLIIKNYGFLSLPHLLHPPLPPTHPVKSPQPHPLVL